MIGSSELPPAEYLREHVLATLDREPIGKQIEILTSLAAIEPAEATANAMRRMADDLRSIQRNQRQLVLDLRASNRPGETDHPR